jgi:hypothetical protein
MPYILQKSIQNPYIIEIHMRIKVIPYTTGKRAVWSMARLAKRQEDTEIKNQPRQVDKDMKMQP